MSKDIERLLDGLIKVKAEKIAKDKPIDPSLGSTSTTVEDPSKAAMAKAMEEYAKLSAASYLTPGAVGSAPSGGILKGGGYTSAITATEYYGGFGYGGKGSDEVIPIHDIENSLSVYLSANDIVMGDGDRLTAYSRLRMLALSNKYNSIRASDIINIVSGILGIGTNGVSEPPPKLSVDAVMDMLPPDLFMMNDSATLRSIVETILEAMEKKS